MPVGVLLIGALASGAGLAQPASTETYGPTQPGETLWSIAAKLKAEHPHATIAQLAWALYRANPAAFAPETMTLRSGKQLKVPDRAYIESVSARESKRQVLGEGATVATVAVAPDVPTSGFYGPTVQGETLWSIATRLQQRFSDATVAQVAWALSQANAEAFSAKALRTGVELNVPTQDFILKTPPAEAKQQVFARFDSVPEDFFVVAEGAVQVPPGASPAVPAPAPAPAAAAADAAPAAAEPAQPEPPQTQRFRDSAVGMQLMQNHNQMTAAALYAQLKPLQAEYGGDTDYDYLLGTSALDDGKLSEAVFALQRVVATLPAFAGARLDLARAHYALGDNEEAKSEFLTLRAQNPPPEIARVIDQYLSATELRAAAYEPQASGYAALSAGYDSNANGATDSTTFLGFILNNQSVSQGSSYAGVNAGVDGSYPLAPGVRGTLGLSGLYKHYPDASFVDSALGRVAAGVEGRLRETTLGLGLSTQYQMLDGDYNNRLNALDAYGAQALNDQWRVGANLRYAMLRYEAPLQIMDVDQIYLGLFGEGALTRTLRVSSAITLGRDEEQMAGSPFGRSLGGLRFGASYELARSVQLFSTLAGVFSNYSGLFFGAERNDRQYSINLGANWHPGWLEKLTIVTQLTAIENQSDVLLYEYRRMDAGIVLRRDFQ